MAAPRDVSEEFSQQMRRYQQICLGLEQCEKSVSESVATLKLIIIIMESQNPNCSPFVTLSNTEGLSIDEISEYFSPRQLEGSIQIFRQRLLDLRKVCSDLATIGLYCGEDFAKGYEDKSTGKSRGDRTGTWRRMREWAESVGRKNTCKEAAEERRRLLKEGLGLQTLICNQIAADGTKDIYRAKFGLSDTKDANDVSFQNADVEWASLLGYAKTLLAESKNPKTFYKHLSEKIAKLPQEQQAWVRLNEKSTWGGLSVSYSFEETPSFSDFLFGEIGNVSCVDSALRDLKTECKDFCAEAESLKSAFMADKKKIHDAFVKKHAEFQKIAAESKAIELNLVTELQRARKKIAEARLNAGNDAQDIMTDISVDKLMVSHKNENLFRRANDLLNASTSRQCLRYQKAVAEIQRLQKMQADGLRTIVLTIENLQRQVAEPAAAVTVPDAKKAETPPVADESVIPVVPSPIVAPAPDAAPQPLSPADLSASQTGSAPIEMIEGDARQIVENIYLPACKTYCEHLESSFQKSYDCKRDPLNLKDAFKLEGIDRQDECLVNICAADTVLEKLKIYSSLHNTYQDQILQKLADKFPDKKDLLLLLINKYAKACALRQMLTANNKTYDQKKADCLAEARKPETIKLLSSRRDSAGITFLKVLGVIAGLAFFVVPGIIAAYRFFGSTQRHGSKFVQQFQNDQPPPYIKLGGD